MDNWQYFKTKPKELLDKYSRYREVAKVLKLSPKARQRLEWIIFNETKAHGNVSLTCRHYGIARKTFYQWHTRFNPANLRTLEDDSRAPVHVRQPEYTPLEEQRVIELRLKYPTAGRDKVKIFYEEEYGEPIKEWSLRRIIHDRKLFAQRAVKTNRQKAQKGVVRKKRLTELQKKPVAGFLVEADTIVIYFSNEHRYVLTAIDHHSRLAFAYMYKTKASKNAADFLKRLVLLFGSIENIHIDNGSEFKGQFQEASGALGIELYHARPYRAQDKPIIERFNGIIQQEYIDLGNFSLDVDYFNQKLVDWLIYYNFQRPHHSLGLKRPAEFANMKRKEVLPMSSPITIY
jgi:transposase InsO family protein